MKIAYLATRFPFHSQTFVLSEVVAHDRAGIDVLPLSCDRALDERPVSEVGRYWQDRTVRPGGPLAQVAALSGATIRYPRAMFKNAAWLVRLLFIDPGEFVKGAKELFTAASLAPACERHGTELIHVHFASRSLTAGIMLGLHSPWEQIAAHLGRDQDDLVKGIRTTFKRRNNIVHRGDRDVGCESDPREEITYEWAKQSVETIENVCMTLGELVNRRLEELRRRKEELEAEVTDA